MSKIKPTLAKLSINAAKVRKESFNGRPHTVIPAVVAVAGVLNGAKVTAEELGRFPKSWDGRPIPILHPQKHGEFVSANIPDVLERTVGTCFNTYMDGEALKTEFWIDDEKMDRLGYSALLAAMADGTAIVEVSTSYFADTVVSIGEFKGKPHEVEHKNLRPDHVALLPNEVGACSIEDGCGAPRVNSERCKVNELIEALRIGLGIKANCGCDGATKVNVLEVAEKLKANGTLTGKQFDAIQSMDEEQRGMVGAILEALGEADKARAKAEKNKAKAKASRNADDDVDDDDDASKAAQKNNSQQGKLMTNAEINALVDQRVADRLDRVEVRNELKANSNNPFSDDELDTLPVATLKKVAKSIRPVDYSGQGGFAVHSISTGSKASSPLLANRGVLTAPPKGESK